MLEEFSEKGTHFKVIEAGNMNPRQTAAVAPVNWKASQMLGMKVAPRNMRAISTVVIRANLLLLLTRGPEVGKRRPSILSLNG